MTLEQEAALARLAEAARADIEALAYPDKAWVPPVEGPDGAPAADVLIVGGGQSGLAIAAALKREGVGNVVLLDRAPRGAEGPWLTFARMPELRTPKITVGTDFGIPNLSVRRWYEARYGEAAWNEIVRLPRTDWADYLAWYRDVWAIEVENDTAVTDIRDGGGLVAVETVAGGVARTRHARLVVIATGTDGAGAWRVPELITASLPADRYDHSNQPIDFAKYRGRRIGILGHGASAFDNAVAALEAGAASVDLCFRRARLPRVNPHRFIETAGMMTHHPLLADELRWRIARHFRRMDQPPAWRSFEIAMAMPNFRLHPGSPWTEIGLDGDAIRVTTPKGVLHVDHLIAATGQAIDLSTRPELSTLHGLIARWSDRFSPAAGEEDARLAALPYLGPGYEFQPREPGRADWVDRVFAFNSSSFVSQGPHSTSISGHRHALPRLVRGLTARLFLDQEPTLLAGLEAYAEMDLPLADDFEESLAFRL